MAEKTISAIVEAGRATAGPPLGPAMGPLGINIGKVIAEINDKTKEFAGVSLPIKVIVDTSTKAFRIEVGSPSVAALIKKELKLEAAAGGKEPVASLSVDQAIKVSRMKEAAMLGRTKRAILKEVVGSCVSMGIVVDDRDPRAVQKEIDAGDYDDKIEGRTPLVFPSDAEMEKKKAEFKRRIEERKKREEEEKKKAEEAKAAAAAAAPAAAAPAAGEKAPAAAAGKPEAGAKPTVGAKPPAGGKPAAEAPAKKGK